VAEIMEVKLGPANADPGFVPRLLNDRRPYPSAFRAGEERGVGFGTHESVKVVRQFRNQVRRDRQRANPRLRLGRTDLDSARNVIRGSLNSEGPVQKVDVSTLQTSNLS
jgi:hypothetical protein